MMNIPDVEVELKFIGVRSNPSANGYRPAHLVRDDYLTTGVHQYYDSDKPPLIGKIKGTIEFITPEYYPSCLWIGKRINMQEGSKIIGYATIIKIFNTVLIDPSK